MIEYCAVMLTMIAMAVVPHLAMAALVGIALYLLWRLWPLLLALIVAIPLVIFGGTACFALMYGIGWCFSWVMAHGLVWAFHHDMPWLAGIPFLLFVVFVVWANVTRARPAR